ncbi:MAG TPA: M3 family metallopeptidase [Conexivisphaerales archaeon]|nr:M3 family metallopeptidase [Conexivisphaerales archaeon]
MEEISWDLTEIFPSTTDPSIQAAIDGASKEADSFAEKYRGKIGSLAPVDVRRCIQDYEALQVRIFDLDLFSTLAFQANMTLTDTQALHDRASKIVAGLNKELAFFEVELGARVSKERSLPKEASLATYSHALERLGRRAIHFLSESEEKLVITKDQFGVRAWEELQNRWLNTREIEVSVEGVRKTMSYGEANGLLHHHDRATRESANRSIYGTLGGSGEIFSFALRSICNDWVNVGDVRRYSSPMEASLIANDTEKGIIDGLLSSVEGHVELYRRYLRLKAKLMGLHKLGCHDIVAPLPQVPDLTYDYETAKALVTKAYVKFDDEYAAAVKDMLARRHLDLSPRFGKMNGAFCAPWYRGRSAFVFASFNGHLNDVFTMAHELGHATHDYYFEARQSYLNMDTPSIVAETASIFGELLMTDLLTGEAKSESEKMAVLCHVLDEAGMVIFQVTARAWFEQSLYDAIRRGEYLDYKGICRRWTAARDRIYGDDVEWFNELEAEWTMKPHYYFSNYRFYNYPYVYAQLFVYAAYERYLREGRAFVPKFKEALSLGSSKSPAEIGRVVGLDVADPSFWDLGFGRFEHFLSELEKVSKS